MALFVPPKPQIINPAGTHDCYFQGESASVCRLIPFGGNQIMISGVRQTIPAAGVTLAPNTAWASFPILYAGAFMNAGVMTLTALDPNAGAFTLDPYGMPIVTGYPQYTIVGAFTQNGTSGFFLSGQFAGAISYWNRRARTVKGTWNAAMASASWIEISSAARLALLFFTGDCFRFKYSGTVYADTVNCREDTTIYYSQNGSAYAQASPVSYFLESVAYSTSPFGLHWDAGPAGGPGQIVTSLFVETVGAGTGTWYGDCTCDFEG